MCERRSRAGCGGVAEQAERAAGKGAGGYRGVAVIKATVDIPLTDGGLGEYLDDLFAGDEADGVEVVDAEVAEHAAGAGDVGLGGGFRVVADAAKGVEGAQPAGGDQVGGGLEAGIEAARKPICTGTLAW